MAKDLSSRLGPVGIPRYYRDNNTYAKEQRDTVNAVGITSASGSATITDGNDVPVAIGETGTAGTWSNAWFNASWFNADWFNTQWFKPTDLDGTANVTEQGDTVTAVGAVKISITGAVTEQADVVSAIGAIADERVGSAAITEGRDTVNTSGLSIITGTATVVETADVVSATGSIGTALLHLQWTEVGTMVNVRIYRSTDNVTFTLIDTVTNGDTEYYDLVTDVSVDYYYYLVGTLTTGGDSTQSDTVEADLPNAV
jgi:hypothetical protein